MIKLISKKLLYFEQEKEIILDIDGKQVVVTKYQKQDPQFNDYELTYDFENEETLPEDEKEKIIEYIDEVINE